MSSVVGLFIIGLLCVVSSVLAEPIPGGDVGPAAKAPEQAQSPELNEAVERFKQQDIDGALKLLREAVKKDADLPPPHVILAQMFAQANLPAAMRGALERATVESPDDPQAFLIFAELALGERRMTEARLLYDKADELMSKWKDGGKRKQNLQPQLYSGLAACAESRNDWAAARKQLEAWLKLEPRSAAALQRLAFCMFQERNVTEALAKLQEAAKIQTDMMAPQAVIAQWFARAGDKKSAQKWLDDALAAAPKDAQVQLVAAQWCWELGKLEEAEAHATEALKLNPKYYMAKILRGVIALFRKDYATAEMYFESAQNQSPKDFAAGNNLALALIEQKDDAKKRKALDLAENNVKLFPRSADAYSTYGWVLYKLGRTEEAEKALRTAVSGGTFGAETAYYLARVLADRGREADARKLLESAVASTGPFAQREEAKALLERLKK
jgi:Tfp pilus assembly protein PilF